MIKVEAEEMEDNEQFPKAEKDTAAKEEAEGGSEDGMEEGFDEERTEEDEDDEERDGDEEGDSLNEPQDLSLVDYSRYDSVALPDAHAAAAAAAAAAEGACVPGAMTPRIQTTGKLNCDICGLSCVSINVLLVHKRSHTGKHRNTAPTPDLKHSALCNHHTVDSVWRLVHYALMTGTRCWIE